MAEYIDRQAVLDAIPQANEDKTVSLFGVVADFIVLVNEIPASDVAPVVHGHWRKSKEGVCGDYLFVCSACGADYWESPSYCKQAHYCPNCGAKMD